MSEFDSKAREWDKDKMHTERSKAIAFALEEMVLLNHSMKALEYGAGTGILSFLLHSKFGRITLMDSSKEMIRVCDEKIDAIGATNMHTVLLDLEKEDFSAHFDIIYNQMVLHHVVDIKLIFNKFYSMLNPGGILAIADLYTEDGSFHGPEVNVHLGFDPKNLVEKLRQIGFKKINYKKCFTIKRENGSEYDVFIVVAEK